MDKQTASNKDFLVSAETVEGPAMQTMQTELPGFQKFFAPAQNTTVSLRDQAICDFLNRGLKSQLFSLTAYYGKMRIPIKYMTPIENGWLECVMMDDDKEGFHEEDPRVVIKNYTNFLLVFKGMENKLL